MVFKDPLAGAGAGGAMLVVGLLVAITSDVVAASMLVLGALGTTVCAVRLRKEVERRRRGRLWALFAAASIFLATGLATMISSAPVAAALTLAGGLVTVVGVVRFRSGSRRLRFTGNIR